MNGGLNDNRDIKLITVESLKTFTTAEQKDLQA